MNQPHTTPRFQYTPTDGPAITTIAGDIAARIAEDFAGEDITVSAQPTPGGVDGSHGFILAAGGDFHDAADHINAMSVGDRLVARIAELPEVRATLERVV